MLPNPFFDKINHHFTVEKSSTKIWATSAMFEKLPNINSRPIGENSPNLVNLKPTNEWFFYLTH
jgi:hypothetical protein